jgi:hypothetical protein
MEPTTFTKGGQTRETASPAEAVRFRFEGWKEGPRAGAPLSTPDEGLLPIPDGFADLPAPDEGEVAPPTTDTEDENGRQAHTTESIEVSDPPGP